VAGTIDALLAVLAPGEALAPRLELARRSWGKSAARSRLTPSGMPIEVSLRSGETSLAWTVEPGPPDGAPADKWRHLLAIAPDVAAWNLPLATELRQAAGQRFGCWLGLRDGGSKLYQEVTPGAQALIRDELARDVPCDTAMLLPALIGFTQRQREYYCRLPRTDRAELHRICATLGLAGGLPLLLDCLGWLGQRRVDVLLDTLRTGISLKLVPGEPVQLTLFWHANDLFPTDVAAARISMVARQLGVSFSELNRIVNRGVRVGLGMIGLSLDRDSRVTLSVSIWPASTTRYAT